MAFVGIALWGLHMGLTQGLLASFVASVALANRIGTAFGVFNLTGGLALLAASLLAGSLWEVSGGSATLLVGPFLAVIGLAAAATLLPRTSTR